MFTYLGRIVRMLIPVLAKAQRRCRSISLGPFLRGLFYMLAARPCTRWLCKLTVSAH